MKLTTDKGELTLPADFSFEIEQNSAFFSNDGAASVAATIPATPADLAKLGYPTRLARQNVFMNAFPALLQKGTFQKRGVLVVAGAGRDGVTCSIALEDSEFYSLHKDKNLRDVFSSKVITSFSSAQTCAEWLVRLYKGLESYDDFRLAPVAVNYDADTDSYQVNNEPLQEGSGLYDLVHGPRSVEEHGEQVSVPEGYGLAPFLTLSTFFSTMFEQLGYTVSANVFATNDALKDLILLHNCSDVACNGRIRYADLVPNKTVGDIVDWLKNKFHAQIAVHPETHTVDIVLMEDVLGGAPDLDLSRKIVGDVSLSYAEGTQVVLNPDTSLDGASPAADTLPDFMEKYGGYIDCNEEQFEDVFPGAIAHRLSTGDFYEVKNSGKVRIGSGYFAFDRRVATKSTAFSPADKMPPMVYVNGILMPFVGSRSHRNTVYKDSKIDDAQELIVAEFAGLSASGHYKYATTQKYDDAGSVRTGGHELDCESLYFQFFEKFGRILLNNKVTVSARWNLTIGEIFSYSLYSLKLLHGQKLLPVAFKYEVGRSVRCLETQCLLVKNFADGQGVSPIAPPAQNLRWQFNNSEIEELDRQRPPEGYRYEREWASDDPYQVDVPEFHLRSPQYAGERSYIVLRQIDRYKVDVSTGTRTFYETVQKAQWYDAVAV